MKTFFTSYTYIYEHNYRIFDYFKNKDNLALVLPKKWKSTKGNKVTIYTPKLDNLKIIAAATFFYHSKYPIIKGQLKGWMPSLWFILKKHAKTGDIFFSSYEPNLLVTYLYNLIAKNLGLKHVFFSWQNVPYRERMSGAKLRLIEWLLKKNIELSAAGVFGTQKAFEIHKNYIQKFNPDLKTAVFNQAGVDTNLFNPDTNNGFKEKHGLTNKKIVVYSATFTLRKGTIQTVEAFAMVCKEVTDAHLVIIGTGELAEQVKSKILELRIQDVVTMLPWQPISDLATIYAQSDIMIHPSIPFEGWEEQWGFLMVQAQACGIPVITTKTGSLEETVLDGKTGLLVDSFDPKALAEKMKHLLTDTELRSKMGKNARQYVVDHFSYQSTAKRMEEFLSSL